MDISKYKLKWIVNTNEIMVNYEYFKNYIKYMDKELNIYKENNSVILYEDFVLLYDNLEKNYREQIKDIYYNLLNNEYNMNSRFNYILLRHTKLLI